MEKTMEKIVALAKARGFVSVSYTHLGNVCLKIRTKGFLPWRPGKALPRNGIGY